MFLYIQRPLEVNDLAVVVAEDGPSALENFQNLRPDLAVSDIGILMMNNLEQCPSS